jgi:hypothetical protein
MDLARRGVGLAREAAAAAGREEVAVAFAINGDIEGPESGRKLRLLARALEEEPPDLILPRRQCRRA